MPFLRKGCLKNASICSAPDYYFFFSIAVISNALTQLYKPNTCFCITKKSTGVWECCKFEAVRAAGRCGCYLRYVVLVSAAASWLLSYLACGAWSRFYLMLASPDTSFCQSQPGQMPVHPEHTDTYLQRRAGWLQQQGSGGCGGDGWLRRERDNSLCVNMCPTTVSECVIVGSKVIWVFIINERFSDVV